MATKDKRKRRFSFILLFVLIVTSIPLTTFASNMRTEVIRVGYRKNSPFIRYENGIWTGYGVDYLEKLAEYTMWDYEYVELEPEEIEPALRSGDTDLSLIMEEELESPEGLIHSEYSVGFENTVVYALEGSDYYYEDYEKLEGTTVGLVRGNVHTEQFRAFAEANSLHYTPQLYESTYEALEALENKEVDVVAAGSYYNYVDVRVVGCFNPLAYYIYTGKQNSGLMEKIDNALRHMKFSDAAFTGRLFEKYFGNSVVSQKPSFTKEEAEYIQNAGTFVVKLLADSKPLSYTNKEGASAGVFEDFFHLLEEKSGLKFDLQAENDPARMNELTRQLPNADYLMLRTKGAIEVSGVVDEVLRSSPLVSTHLAYISRRETALDENRNIRVFALTRQMQFVEQMIMHHNPDYEVQLYDTAQECLDAVVKQDADMAVLDAFLMSYLLQRPIYGDRLVQCNGMEWTNDLCVVANPNEETLINIINKTIMHISEMEREEISTRQLLLNPYPLSFGDVLYKYQDIIGGILVLTVITMIVYAILIRHITRLRFQKQDYERLQTKIQQDELTGIYNRPYFFRRAREAINASKREMCIVLLNIENFQTVNNFYGMDTGDKLLVEIAHRLEDIGKRREIIAGRFTGDYFYLCMAMEDFLAEGFPRHFQSELVDIELHLSYGVFRVEDQKDLSVSGMCVRASIALHNQNDIETEYIHYYSKEQHNRLLYEQQIESSMKTALEEGHFCVFVQPKYDVEHECIVGGEALVRWKHPEHGMIPPMDFISIFERTGFILQLDYFVWEETCRLIAEWKKRGIFSGSISVNVSRAHFFGKELKDRLLSLVRQYGIEPKDLQLEVTETMCAENEEIITRRVAELQRCGFEVAMDDFGSGYSSLNMLKEMPLNVIKMDLRFLDGAGDERKSRYILEGLIRMAHQLKLQVVVEGVETLEQVEFLRTIGNIAAQGYYYSKPVPNEDYTQMLLEQAANEGAVM